MSGTASSSRARNGRERSALSLAEIDLDLPPVIDVNLIGLYLALTGSRQMIAKAAGESTSRRSRVEPVGIGLPHYDASKHRAWGFTKNVALELAQHGIRVNAIAPGASRRRAPAWPAARRAPSCPS